jgi:cytochrome c peroxidase
MKARHGAWGILLLVTGAVGAPGLLRAAQPQVPSLPTQTAGYVQYAITNLPNYYTIPAIATTNNTPLTNPLTDSGATLGRVLFYDKRLSHSNGVACASCHRQQNGFSDPNQFSEGVAGLTGRHSMGLTNATYYTGGKAFWDERAASLEDQALQPIQNAVEMGSTLTEVIGKLNQTSFYPTLFQAAFGTTEISADRIGKAIAQFERAMVSYNSKFDGVKKQTQQYTPQEVQGQLLFTGAARCNQCHTTDAHVSNGVHNIGLDATNTDVGAGNGTFKSPSLRNVAVRGKFMHDGRFSTLQEVIQFYSTGVQDNPDLDPVLRNPLGQVIRLNLNQTQIDQLVAYLNAFTDNTFLTSPLFSDPFVTLPGDYTGDGVVDQLDYDVWKSSFGDTSSLLADGNANGVIDSGDYVVWRNNVGRTWLDLATGSGTNLASAVPEPGAVVLLIFSVLFAMVGRRRR